MEELQSFLRNLDFNQNKRIIFAVDFKIFFYSNLEIKGGKPIPKRKSIAKLVEIKESLDICDIWRIRNPNTRNFICRQNHSTWFIERRLDYIFIPNCLLTQIYYITCSINLSFYIIDLTFKVINPIKMVMVFGNLIIL